MYKLCKRALSILLLTAINAAPQQPKTPQASTTNTPKVHLISAVKVRLNMNDIGHLIRYEYDFPGHKDVYIKQLGTVSNQGAFEYVTAEENVQFQDRLQGDVLFRLPIAETSTIAAKPPLLPLPTIDDFPPDGLPFTWDSAKTLQERAQNVLNNYFHLVPGADCSHGMQQMRTTFAPLQLANTSRGVTAEVALLIVFPCAPQGIPYSFQVRSLVMEGRTHSDTVRHTTDFDIVNAADQFVRLLISKMQGAETTKP